ncbi:anaphase-promoting complex subunit 3 [Nematocida homosporus]|uniref:anaphase-promoting complex subunit 3 n=1 Tax=Nematocida homosporus TaxID=1912981 RepID=UPI00221FE7D9|nr:anaphase-promoting complex subunit 3 [Nematocida homosporus]KAI5185636.1 anaphase-promoting complex subunit 3 [Nematocida homosporus]
MMDLERFLSRCLKYGNFDDAIYVAEVLSVTEGKDYSLLLGYLFMRKLEYRRAIYYLAKTNSFSSLYYRAQCFKALREYDKAKYLLSKLEGYRREEKKKLSEVEKLFVLDPDDAFVLSALGEINILSGAYEKAINNYSCAAQKNPLLYTGHRAVLEEHLTNAKNIDAEEENNNNVFVGEGDKLDKKTLSLVERRIEAEVVSAQGNRELATVLSSLLVETRILESITNGESSTAYTAVELDALPLSTVSAMAVHFFDVGSFQKSADVFDYVLLRDPCYIDALHYYSSILWHKRDRSMLASLARTVFGVNPFSAVAWAVLGNHYSLRKETDKAITSFERSLVIKKDPYVLCLLGHEHFMNSNLRESLRCFISSIQMKAGNHNGMAGCGLIYEKMGKKESAEYCFMRAVRSNPQNVLLGYLSVKFLVQHQKIDKAYALLRRYLRIDESLGSLAEKIENNLLRRYLLPREQNEHMSFLLESLLLELACILAHTGHCKAAEILARETAGKGQLFQARKTQVLDTIALHASNLADPTPSV